jgi:hypothetical protein
MMAVLAGEDDSIHVWYGSEVAGDSILCISRGSIVVHLSVPRTS